MANKHKVGDIVSGDAYGDLPLGTILQGLNDDSTVERRADSSWWHSGPENGTWKPYRVAPGVPRKIIYLPGGKPQVEPRPMHKAGDLIFGTAFRLAPVGTRVVNDDSGFPSRYWEKGVDGKWHTEGSSPMAEMWHPRSLGFSRVLRWGPEQLVSNSQQLEAAWGPESPARALLAKLRALADEWDARADYNSRASGTFWRGMTTKGRECSDELRQALAPDAGAIIEPKLTPGGEVPYDKVPDADLPGMWELADFTGGDPDERSHAQRKLDAERVTGQHHLDQLQKVVQLEADLAALTAGQLPGATSALVLRAAVKAAFTCAILNGLIIVRPPEEWPFIIERNKP